MTAGTVPFSNIGAGAIRPRKPQKAWRAALDCPGPSARVSPWAPRAYARARRVSPGGAGRAEPLQRSIVSEGEADLAEAQTRPQRPSGAAAEEAA